MTTKTCTAPNCSTKAKGLYCPKHKYRMKMYNSFDIPKTVNLCSVEGCNNRSRTKGLCDMHSQRVRKYGQPGEASSRKGNGGMGTISKTTGYRYFYRPSHSNASKNGSVAEHVLVMCEILQRPLRKGENVHHKNGIKLDNRPENLELWTTIQPAGQSVQDMIKFCKEYLAQYEHDASILRGE